MDVDTCSLMKTARIALLTDVEGNWNYLCNVVRLSSCLKLTPNGRDETLDLHDHCALVFGGDAGDKGDDTLKCYEQLLSLKKRYPDRVVLLVGNRDVNKMRITSELHDTEMDLHTMAKEILEGPTWVPKEKRMTLKNFLAEELCRNAKNNATEQIESVNTKTSRLKWMLDHTMGAQGEFERRRTELTRQKVGDRRNITNDDVVASYVNSVNKGGVLRQFLLHGSLAFVAHQTLFVHGGIINTIDSASFSALGRVPDEPLKRYDSVLEWVDKLNAWYRGQVQEWIEQPTWSHDHSYRGGNELLKYVLPNYSGSVVMGRHTLASGMPTPLPDEIALLLSKSGIRRVIIGHTPHGNSPTVVKQPKQQRGTCAASHNDSTIAFEDVIMCDTSYSDTQAPDNRGRAASSVELEPNGRVLVKGVLEDGQFIEYNPEEDPWVGNWLRDGTMVKARLINEELKGENDTYLVFRVENGYSYKYDYRTVTELRKIGLLN